MVNNNSI